jgi:archaellum component FlaC
VVERKKTTARSSAGAARRAPGSQAFTVVLEEVRSQFKVFGEALESLSEKVDRGFEQVDRRFEQVDRRFEKIEHRLDGIDVRLDGIDVRLDGIDVRLDGIDVRLDGLTRDMGLVKTAVLDQHRELGTKVNREEVHQVVESAVERAVASARGG